MNFRLQDNGAPEAAAPEELVGGRFRIARPVGRGGMATVYEVVDVATGARLALKLLHPIEDARKRRRSVQLFEREFHTLAHLAHPRVVEVFDYGVDDHGPYYTMELLDGGDLQQQAPVEWRRACALARDVCSALSLLHSRRLVYRDLSPRNVRCTSDGLAKLIDFGALIMMGPSKQVVGTPAYCSPEALNLQALDQRTDMYSLGSMLYFTLAGRHPYPARDFAQLRELWRTRPLAPSELVPGIPAALDGLVLDLMNLDPGGRPANAAEVMERLAAIEGQALDEHLLVPQSYLSTPHLVGREVPLARARAKLMRAVRGRGGAVLVEGASGVGRSRFLDACVLEGKLLGALALRADAADAQGEYGVVRALAGQLLHALPELALVAARPKLSLLGYAVPELLALEPGVALQEFDSPEQIRARVQPALREWLVDVSRQRPLLVAVDDVHAIDEPSAAFVALLAHDVRRRAVLVAVSAETGMDATSPSALKLLADAATRVMLTELKPEDTEQLLRSVFGAVPHVQHLAHKLQAISRGNPRAVMLLAQHLVDKDVVRYKAGVWTLPASIDDSNLPSSMAQALRARIERLSDCARELACAMSLCPERPINLEECAGLSEDSQPARVMASLDELVQAQVVTLAGETCTIAGREWLPALHADLTDGFTRSLHARLAQMFERRGDEGFRVARHLLSAGETERGLHALVAHAEESQQITDQSPDAFFKLVSSMPADWYQTYEQAIQLCERLGRPKREAYTLRSRLSGMMGLLGVVELTQYSHLLDQLRRDSGLADWEALDAGMESMPRLQKALELTQERYNQSSEHERVLEPLLAIRQMARVVIQAGAVITPSLDYRLLKSLPSLVPLEPLSPALSVVGMLVRGLGARITGRLDQARAEYGALLERIAQPDRAGLDESHHRYTQLGVMCGLGMLDASMGLDSSLRWAAQIEVEPLHQVNALLIRMLHHLWQGDMREADRCKERVDLLRIQNSPRQFLENTHLLGQVVASAAADDLTRVKQTVDEIEALAERYPDWVPVCHYGRGEYHRIRGDLRSALQELEQALSLMQPGYHQLWTNAAAAHARALFDLDRPEEAHDRAQDYLALARELQLGYGCIYLRMPLALAQARLGEAARAIENAQAVIDTLVALGSRGLIVAVAYETRARVAIELEDQSGFERYAALCAEQLRAGASRVLTAKYESLKQTAIRAEIRITSNLADAADFTEQLTASQVTSLLDGCRGFSERAHQALVILLKHTGAIDGYFYAMTENGPELAARIGEQEVPSRLAESVREYLEAELRDQETATASVSAAMAASGEVSEWSGMQGERYRMVLLSHPVEGGHAITGVAVAVIRPGRGFAYPTQTASQLSKILLECGDVVPTIVEN